MRIIKVEECNVMGFESETKYFKTLKKAKKYFKKLVKNNKNDLAQDGDCGYQEKPIIYEGYDSFIEKPKGRYKSATLECWYSSETDCGTEYDTTLISITLTEIKIEE